MNPVALPAPALRRFLLLAGALYLAWFFVYDQWLAIDGRLDVALCNHIARTSGAVLRATGFEASLPMPNLIAVYGRPAVTVGPPCNGLVLYALFTGFILAFPGPWRHKLVYIPLGIGLIFLLNIVRVVALALNQHYSHQTVDFNHHYTFSFVVYGFIFWLWMWWARRYTPAAVA